MKKAVWCKDFETGEVWCSKKPLKEIKPPPLDEAEYSDLNNNRPDMTVNTVCERLTDPENQREHKKAKDGAQDNILKVH